MERIKPMLGDVELQQVQQLNIDADQVLTEHEIPALEGNFYQQEGRRGTLIIVSGVLSGVSVKEDAVENPATGLKALREKFKAAEPLSFVSDIMSATDIDEVLIEDMEVTEIAGKPNRFEYAFTLREFTAAPSNPTEPPEIIPPVITETATLIVEVIVVANSAFDFSRVSLTVRGSQTDGTDLFRTLTNRNNNIWTEEDFPPGQYTCEAVVLDTPQMTGNVQAEVRAGETTSVTIVLRSDVKIAQTFMIHYRFDSAFVEPCMLDVLQQVCEFSHANSDLKLVILGHTDLAGSTSYNQALSERRARSAFSVLRFADDNQAAINEWDHIRRPRVSGASLGDSWGAREYQQMLQELGFYSGAISGNHDSATDVAVREFQRQNGLNDDGDVGDSTWPVLIQEYLRLKNLSIPDSQFLPNCSGEILKWLGCSELDPVRDVTFAWRPNRRTEFLFINDDSLPSDVVQPDTFNKPTAGTVNSAWCLNDSSVSSRCCFVKPHVGAGKESCTSTRDPWPREAAEPSPVFMVRGSIKFEDGTPFVGQYTLIAPDGEFMDGEVPTTSGSLRAGTGIKGTTKADGSFEYPAADKHKRPGIFTLEVTGEVVVRCDDQPIEEAKGPFACKRLASDQDSFDVIIVPAALANIMPSIVVPPSIVVKRQHTNPQRQPVVLSVDQAFTGTGIFTRSPDDKILFFTAATGGTALQFDGNDNLFIDAQLLAGVTLFCEGGPNPSDVLDDITLTLQIVVSGQNGRAASEQTTSVLLTLGISSSQTNVADELLILSDTDKIAPGRMLQVQNVSAQATRAMVILRRALPETFAGSLSVQAISNKVQLFSASEEVATPAQTPLSLPQVIANQAIPQVVAAPSTPNHVGTVFWAEALAPSDNALDTGFQLGIDGVEQDGDRVMITAAEVMLSNNVAPFNTAQTRVQIEGVLNRLRSSFDINDLFGTQRDSLFRARVTIAGIAANSIQVTLESETEAGVTLESLPLTLNRTSGNAFVSPAPIMAIPDAIPRADITFAAPKSIETIRCRAQGKLKLSVDAPSLDAGAVEVQVRGRVFQFCTITIQGATPTIAADMTTANRVVAQCGIEFRISSSTIVDNPALLDIAQTDCPLTIGGNASRDPEEIALFALGRDSCPHNFLVYFVRSNSMGLFGCSAFPVGQPGVSVADSASQYTFGHEICHVLHLPHDARANNLMTGAGTTTLPATPNTVRLEPDQCQTMDDGGFLEFLE